MIGIDLGRMTDADRSLALALDLHDRDLCPGGCGHYLDETAEMDGWHEVRKITCDACRARDADDTKPEHGEMRYVIDTRG